MQWFTHDRFGMFIHWGLYAIPARGEWVRSTEEIPEEDYIPFFNEFNPKDFDPKKWARLAKQAGMKYAVLTAKHHDGFCLFDSALTDWKVTNTPYGKDIVRAYLDAFRAEGIKVGLYYSLLDWHHPDYPAYGDRQHPMRNNIAYKDKPYNFDNYLDYMHGQVRELCTNYGKLDMMWFDFSYDDLTGEAWRASELVRMVRSLQPDIIIDNRLEVSGSGFGSIATDEPLEYSGGCDLPKPENGRITRNGKTLYYHIMENSIGGIPLQGISLDEVESIRLISDGTEIKPLKNWIVENYPDVVFVQVSNTVKLPDDIDTVIAVHTK